MPSYHRREFQLKLDAEFPREEVTYKCSTCNKTITQLLDKFNYASCLDCGREWDWDCACNDAEYCNCELPVNHNYLYILENTLLDFNDENHDIDDIKEDINRRKNELDEKWHDTINKIKQLKLKLKNERTNNQSSNQQEENTFLQEEAKEKE